jgi:hypothetical protein
MATHIQLSSEIRGVTNDRQLTDLGELEQASRVEGGDGIQ